MASVSFRKYVLFILCTFISLNFLSVIWLFTGYFSPKRDTYWIDTLYRKKEAFARSISGPKIVIVSGSSGLFGISAAKIESYFQIPTVNLCTHAGLRDYYLERSKKSINPGDLVIFAPEYAQYLFDFPMSEIKSDYILNFDKSYLKRLSIDEKLYILKAYANPWKIIKARFVNGKNSNFQKDNIGYQAKNLNRNGDETSNYGTKNRAFEPICIRRGFDPNEYGIHKISEFLNWCEQNGVTVIVSWPATLPFKESHPNFNARFIDSLITHLSNFGIEVLGKPEDFFVSQDYLYDTIYHLNRGGVSFRTQKLIDFIETSQSFMQWYDRNGKSFETVTADFSPLQMIDVCINGSMEKSGNDQPLGWQAVTGKRNNPDGVARWDNSCAHDGNHSLKLNNTSAGQVRWLGEKCPLPPGIRRIHIGGWSKSEGINEYAKYCINLKVFFKNGSFKWNARELNFLRGTHDWNQVQTVFTFDEEISAVQPFLLLHGGTGVAWFDDIFIQVPSQASKRDE